MTVLNVVLFFHIASVVGLFAALAIEGVAVRNLRRVTSFEQAREWTRLWPLLLPLGLPAVLIVFASGIYLATTLGAWELSWVRPTVPALLLIAIAGAITGPRRNKLQAALANGSGNLPGSMRDQLRQPVFVGSWRVRAALMSAFVFVMAAKPESPVAEIVMGAAIVIGIAWSLPEWRTRSLALAANE